MITYTESEILNSPYTNFIQVPTTDVHNHTYWEFLIPLSGTCYHVINDKRHKLSSGKVMFLRPIKDVHYFDKENCEEIYRHRDVYITDEEMKKWCDMISPELYNELLEPDFPITFSISSSMIKYTEEVFNVPNFNLSNSISVLRNIHFAVAINLLTAYQFTKLPSSQPDWLNDFIEDLRNPDNFVYSIEELTAKIPYSHGHICREFKKATKQTIVNYFNLQKINHASFLLMNTNLKVLNISVLVGYSSPKNFIKQFTKVFNLSPSAWRTKNQLTNKK